ncbi:hypothetical protein [Anatilimnocola floriformis]|uniref:hypothetical protein n=1 Tax=Anatilimnocola floriformis TaxID=2948575 RepID=UPI0020C40E34|nr:hypothetical protein [Anatilimnocola floriformis]
MADTQTRLRAVIVHGDGTVTTAVGGNRTGYNLDDAIQKGARIIQITPIGTGTSIMLLVEEPKS